MLFLSFKVTVNFITTVIINRRRFLRNGWQVLAIATKKLCLFAIGLQALLNTI
jgi:hypothetical protein